MYSFVHKNNLDQYFWRKTEKPGFIYPGELKVELDWSKWMKKVEYGKSRWVLHYILTSHHALLFLIHLFLLVILLSCGLWLLCSIPWIQSLRYNIWFIPVTPKMMNGLGSLSHLQISRVLWFFYHRPLCLAFKNSN